MATKSQNWKYVIIIMLFLGWSLGNFDRFIINFAILDIAKEFNLTESLTGIVLSSFFAGYALMQIPGGWLADRFGYRKILILTVLVWSIFTALTGAAWSLISLVIIRFLFGVGEGSFFPSASKGIANWFPVKERSKAMSFMLISGSLMGVVAPLVGTRLMETIGWRSIFYIVGGLGIFFALAYFFFLTERKSAETVATVQAPQTKAPLRTVLKSLTIWQLFIAYFSLYIVNWGLMAWMPIYLSKAKGLDLSAVGTYSAIPPIAGIFAVLVSGYILDKMPQGKDRLVGGIAALVAGGFLILMSTAPDMITFTIYQCVVTAMLSFNIILITTVPLKTLPDTMIGTTNGFINTGAQLAGVLAPTLIGFLVEASGGSYTAAFIMLISFSVVCAIALFTIRTKAQRTTDIITSTN
ncbi:MFS transporter [Lysinibacillus piscis]|uniref:MFS transporter n=1 Tax=Lysinibacillus piscis TaxID=2518931 RepID=A0ABQ5NJY4_9BACI|nr:MFS transporter [Lysinibacillus sp. KH24]GLC88386.1 MFS transporter [Lysinibacillus sp. KH24]